MLKSISLVLKIIAVVLGVTWVWMYLKTGGRSETDLIYLPDKLAAVGLVLASAALAVLGKGLDTWHRRRRLVKAVGAVGTGNPAPEHLDVIVDEVRRAAAERPPIPEPGPETLFRPLLSPNPSESWIGGEPEMETGLEWPRSGKVPMTFLAQVDCGEITGGACQGLLPDEGWLVFFYAASHEPNACVIHTRTRGPRRATPEIQPKGHLELAPRGLIDPPRHAPRIPIAPAAENADAEALFNEERRYKEADGVSHTVNSWFEAYDLKNSAYQPFDAASAQALIHAVHGVLLRSAK